MTNHAWPHAEGHGEPILLTFVGAQRLDEGSAEIAFEIENVGAYAATLRGAATAGAERVVISRIRHFLGWEVASPIDHLRLEPGQLEYLAPPDYQVLIQGLAPDANALQIDLDFGPLGVKTLPVTIRP
ncbi:MAG: hypothetical protein HC871_16200 [Rhizobiales bacterium]|nr:hypothetical protein [Hyphomicrobiales bacterium]